MTRYHMCRQHNGRGFGILRMVGTGSTEAIVIAADLPEEDARAALAAYRREEIAEAQAAEVLDESYPIEKVYAEIRAAGGDPDAIGQRGAALVRDLLARRKPTP